MKLVSLVLVTVLFSSCVERKVGSVPTVDLANPVKSREIILSELLDDIRVIKLETNDSTLLGPNAYYLISNKYIISIDREKILQFSGNGELIRILLKAGKGPAEFTRAEAFALDDKNGILYINHRGDSHHISSYNLNTGQRTRRIATRVDNLITQIIVTGDSILTIVPMMNKEFNFYYLSASGNFISGFPPPKARNIGFQTSITRVNNQLFYMPKEYDTLYAVNGKTYEPYCFFKIENRFSYDNNEIGNFIYLSSNAPGFMIASKAHARIRLNSGGETFTMNADKQTRYFISKKNLSVCEISDFYNDFLGFREKVDQWDDYFFVTNNMGYVCYSSFEFKQKIRDALISGKIDSRVRQRISDLNAQINENDNPLLVVGILK